MKRDALFNELFRIDPQSLFELLQLKVEGNYEFDSSLSSGLPKCHWRSGRALTVLKPLIVTVGQSVKCGVKILMGVEGTWKIQYR